MAVLAQTKTTSDAIGNREDLSDKIVRIYADEMPMQAMAKTVKAKAVDHDWLTTDIRKGVLGNAQPEGFRATQTAAKLRKRLRNKCQIPTEGGSVSATQEATDKAGIKSEYKEQKRLKLTEYNLDIEATLMAHQSELANECLVVQSKVIQIAKLRPTTTKPLPIAGSSREFFVDGECTLKITNPKGLGIIADVNAA